MKVIISRIELLALISKIQGVVPAKPPIPVLANVLIESQDDQIIFSVTDLTVSMRVFAPAKVLEEGAIALPARRFFQLIRELTAPQIEIHANSNETASINAGTSRFKIQGMSKDEFPALPDFSDGKAFTIPNVKLKEMLSRTLFAAARDDSRQVLNGINLNLAQNQAIFIGTDGKRLARLMTPIESTIAHEGSYILPLKAVEEIIKLLDEKEVSSELTFLDDKIAIEGDNITLFTKLIVGEYPDVTRVIPQKSEQSLSLHREELISLLRQVSLFTTDTSSSIRFTFQSGQLNLSAVSSELGEGNVTMPVNYSGPTLEIAFNPHYFLDILRHSKDEIISFDITDPYNPGLVTDSTNAQFVIMPMRLEAHAATT
jgi:DNA polymerase-3 subunit beta